MEKVTIPFFEQRHELLNVLVEKMALPNLELNQELSHKWTIKTLQKASEYWPKQKLVLVIGSDLVKDLPNWVDAIDILKQSQLGIVPRKGWPLIKSQITNIEVLGGQIQLLPLTIPAASSSTFRNEPYTSQIPPSILSIIKEQNLYGLKQ